MTQETMKKFDRRIRSIQDPFGTGYFLLYITFRKLAEHEGRSMHDIVRQYNFWKLKNSNSSGSQ